MRKHFWTGRFEGYSWQYFQKDLLSGVIVGIIAIPLGMAFAGASGVNPEYGIYTTIIAGILISLFGGSRFQIGGPTGADRFKNIIDYFKKHNGSIIVSGVVPSLQETLKKSGLYDDIGGENFFEDAVDYAKSLVGSRPARKGEAGQKKEQFG